MSNLKSDLADSIKSESHRLYWCSDSLVKAKNYVREMTNKGEFDTEAHSHWASGYADGLADAIAILKGADWEKLVNEERGFETLKAKSA